MADVSNAGTADAGDCGTDCEGALRDLRAFLDSELGGEARAAIQGHLDACMDCLQAFDFHAELRSVIARKCADELPPELLSRIERCLAESAGTADGSLD
jgi:mycothiol system anti-sigma-R factor